MKQRKKVFVLAAVMLILTSVLVACDDDKVEYNPLQSAYNVIRNYSGIYSCVEHAEDWSYVYIDTNPYDQDDYYNSSYLSLVKKFNEALDLPDSVYKDMLRTSAIDGLQTVTIGSITVKWKYHPDNGLEVSYNYYQ